MLGVYLLHLPIAATCDHVLEHLLQSQIYCSLGIQAETSFSLVHASSLVPMSLHDHVLMNSPLCGCQLVANFIDLESTKGNSSSWTYEKISRKV